MSCRRRQLVERAGPAYQAMRVVGFAPAREDLDGEAPALAVIADVDDPGDLGRRVHPDEVAHARGPAQSGEGSVLHTHLRHGRGTPIPCLRPAAAA
jgi:hypothetical protein